MRRREVGREKDKIERIGERESGRGRERENNYQKRKERRLSERAKRC